MTHKPLNVGIIGTGAIAPAYMLGCSKFPHWIQVTACTDLNAERAAQFAAEYGLRVLDPAAFFDDPDIDIIINLTIPAVHAQVSLQAIAAGKHVYAEKPLAIALEDGRQVIEAAESAGVRVGCAPDTFLGSGGQTARAAIDAGLIGQPLAATAFMLSHGPESWHPNPFFYFQMGGGPMLDMGPYYLTALINLMGPIRQVSGMTSRWSGERVAGHEAIRGQAIPVDVTTHAAGTVAFANGGIASIIMSFDIWAHHAPRIEIHGTTGSLTIPDPNTFDGTVRLWTPGTGAWRDLPSDHRGDVQRGIGVADMARGILTGEPHRASGELAHHVLEAMLAFDTSSASGTHITMQSEIIQPAPLNEL